MREEGEAEEMREGAREGRRREQKSARQRVKRSPRRSPRPPDVWFRARFISSDPSRRAQWGAGGVQEARCEAD